MNFSSIDRIPLDVGDGAPVLCLHGSLGSSAQWRSLAEELRPRHRVLAADLLGYAGEEAWPVAVSLQISDEVRPLLAQLRSLREPMHVVGHSYGAAVALRLALQHAELVRSLTLFEPVAFGWLLAKDPVGVSAREIRGYGDTVVMLVRQGATHAAGRCFVDYWTGRGSWDSFAPERQACLARKMVKVAAEWGAGFTETYTEAELDVLQMPLTLLSGLASPSPARRVIELLDQALPHATTYHVPDVGHMGPFTHAEQFNRTVAKILAGSPAGFCAAA